MSYDFKLTEEIARWRFEVLIQTQSDWFIAFTNPTAGPWKRVMARNVRGIKGEVYRFPRDVDRPDLILVCDRLKTVAIIEAKDSLAKLFIDAQIKKSAGVVTDLTRILAGLGENGFWGMRSQFKVCPGLMWGAERASSDTERRTLVSRFTKELGRDVASISEQCLCIEVLKNSGKDLLTVSTSVYKHEAGQGGVSDTDLVKSLTPTS